MIESQHTHLDPVLVIGVDPDKTRTALAWARQDTLSRTRMYRLHGLLGGGSSRQRVTWSSVTGALEWLRCLVDAEGVEASQVRACVETQAATSPRSRDVESLRRVRYHFDAACELLGIDCEHVDKAAWQKHVTPVAVRGEGAIKRAYYEHAKQLLGARVLNEDQAAAFGIVQWQVESRLAATFVV